MFKAFVFGAALLIPSSQVRPIDIQIAHLTNDALRHAATIIRASESLTDLFQKWSDSSLQSKDFEPLAKDRLKLIRNSSKHVSENPLVARIDRPKEKQKPTGFKSSSSSRDLGLEEIPSVLAAITEKARLVQEQLRQLESGDSDETSDGPERGPNRPTVTLGELQAPRISSLCGDMRAQAGKVAKALLPRLKP